eukprot:gene27172-35897_t
MSSMSSIADNNSRAISSSSKEQAVATPSVNSSRKHAICENGSNKESKLSGKEDQHGLDDKFQPSSDDTLSRGNPIAEFLRNQKGNIKGLSQEEFVGKYEAYVKEMAAAERIEESKSSSTNAAKSSESSDFKERESMDMIRRGSFYNGEGNFKNIVLKFTTLSVGCQEAPSFTVDKRGARIGRDSSNSIAVPSDDKMLAEAHATIEYHRGSFFIVDGGHTFSASIRIGIGSSHNKKWFMDPGARFSAGNSVFLSNGVRESGELEIKVLEGPLKDETLLIKRSGASFGRSSDNTISVPDRELSRKHSKIEFDEKTNRFIVGDLGSTNGTYVQLVGPYGGRYKLNLNDHILVGRTGFSINRYDYGLSEEMGYRQSMEDACAIVQHLNIGPLCVQDLSPQSFFGVFDGHGGVQASHYLAQNLHVNVAHGLLDMSTEIYQVIDQVAPDSIFNNVAALQAMDQIVIRTLKDTFLKTDKDFITTSPHPQHGSTATTALLLGKRLYCANVGDSRTMLCRKFSPILLSQDHKPTREDESKRIRDAGGFVINNRVMGELAVSRAFGDVDFKKGIQSIIEEEGGALPSNTDSNDHKNWDQPLIIAEPDVQVTTITEHDQFLLLACDGLFDVYAPDEVVKFVKESMEKHGDTQRCCQVRVKNSRDNVSVILIILSKWY